GAELDPAGVELGSDGSGHVSADVVAPVGVADVGRGGGEPWLEGERRPHGDGVSREADLVAVVSESSPAMEEQWALAFALLICEVEVVEPPGIVHAREFGVGLLLPVEPPEVDALLLKRMEDKLEVVGGPLFVGWVEGDVFLCCRIDAHGAGHCGVLLLPWLNAGCGVEIERGLEPLLMQAGEEIFRIGKEQMVPCVSGPAETFARLICFVPGLELLAADVPAHIDDEDV